MNADSKMSLLWLIFLQMNVLMIMTFVGADRCTASSQFKMEQCTALHFQGSLGWDTKHICDNIKGCADDVKCSNTCRRNMRVSVFDQQLFSVTMKNTFIDMLTKCCHTCASCSLVDKIENTMYVNDKILNSSDVIFPVLGEASTQMLNGYYFLPAFDIPSSFYFTLKKSNMEIVKEMVYSCLRMWPFLLVCLLMALLSGLVVWVIETSWNKEEFQQRCYKGILDGFWWSFVSMTTVGYGDKVTRTWGGKFYAVFWILTGITICSLFTGTLTSEIIKAREPVNTDMAGQDVAVLKGRIHDIALVAEHGGILRIGAIGHTMRGMNEMINLLQNKSVHGFLVDRNTYYHFHNRIKEGKYKKLGTEFKKLPLTITEKVSKKEFSCGFLIKNSDDYRFFKSYFDNNRLDITSCNSVRINTKHISDGDKSRVFGGDLSLFRKVVTYILLIMGVVMAVVVIYEGRKYWLKRQEGEQTKSLVV